MGKPRLSQGQRSELLGGSQGSQGQSGKKGVWGCWPLVHWFPTCPSTRIYRGATRHHTDWLRQELWPGEETWLVPQLPFAFSKAGTRTQAFQLPWLVLVDHRSYFTNHKNRMLCLHKSPPISTPTRILRPVGQGNPGTSALLVTAHWKLCAYVTRLLWQAFLLLGKITWSSFLLAHLPISKFFGESPK